MQVLRTETNDNTDMDPFYFFPERSDILAKLNQTAVRINPSYSVCFLRYEHQGISANVFFPSVYNEHRFFFPLSNFETYLITK